MSINRNKPMKKCVPGDCNQIARDRAGHRSGAPTPEYDSGYAGIKWNSKKKD